MDIVFLLTFIGFLIIFLALISIVISSVRNGISPMPTSLKTKIQLFEALPSPSQINGTIYELGSGWGTLAIPLAKQYPQSQVIAYETSPVPYWVSRTLGYFILNTHTHLSLVRQDFFQADLNDAALIICYLYPGAMSKLKDKFEKELRSGTWIISNTFAVPGWQPFKVYTVNDLYHTKIFVYKFL